MQIAIEARVLSGKRLGVARYLYNLLRFFPEISDSNQFYLYADYRPIDQSIQHPQIHYRTLKGPRRFLWRHFLLPLEQYKKHFDLLFVPSYSVPLLKMGKTVVTIHDIIPLKHPEWSRRNERIRFATTVKRLAHKVDSIIAASEATKNDLLEFTRTDPNKIEVIYLGVDDHFKVLDKKAEFENFSKKFNLLVPFILYVGAIHPRRNIKRLLEAFRLLKLDTKTEHKLVLIGTFFQSSWKQQIQQYIQQKKLENEIIWLDYITDEELVQFYNFADVFIYPSLYEGFGLPVLEAMACGTPVVTSNSTSLSEVAGDAALLVNPFEIEEIAEALKTIIWKKDIKIGLIEKGKKRASLFTWQKAAQQTIQLFEKIHAGGE